MTASSSVFVELGLPISEAEILDLAAGESVGRPHIAAVMVNRGYVVSIADAFDRYLGRGMPAYMARPRLSPEEAISLARESKAVPILAHPHTLGLNTSRRGDDDASEAQQRRIDRRRVLLPALLPFRARGVRRSGGAFRAQAVREAATTTAPTSRMWNSGSVEATWPSPMSCSMPSVRSDGAIMDPCQKPNRSA